jgi:hypothetical protein
VKPRLSTISTVGGHVPVLFDHNAVNGLEGRGHAFARLFRGAVAEYVAAIRRRIAHVSGLDAPLFSAPIFQGFALGAVAQWSRNDR